METAASLTPKKPTIRAGTESGDVIAKVRAQLWWDRDHARIPRGTVLQTACLMDGTVVCPPSSRRRQRTREHQLSPAATRKPAVPLPQRRCFRRPKRGEVQACEEADQSASAVAAAHIRTPRKQLTNLGRTCRHPPVNLNPNLGRTPLDPINRISRQLAQQRVKISGRYQLEGGKPKPGTGVRSRGF